MAKIVELEGSADPVGEVTDPNENAKNETEKIIQRLMKKVYLLGLSAGKRTTYGSILEKMNQIKNLNPQKQLIILRQWCSNNLSVKNKTNEESKDTTKNIKEDNTNAKDTE